MTYEDFCKKIAEEEGLKKELDIAQIKEVIRIIKEKLLESGIDLMTQIKLMD